MTPKPTWGGKRAGAGRPPLTKARCSCGKHTLARAKTLRLRCGKLDTIQNARRVFIEATETTELTVVQKGDEDSAGELRGY